MHVRWLEEETKVPNFNFIKLNELLVPVSGDGNPIDFYFYFNFFCYSMKVLFS